MHERNGINVPGSPSCRRRSLAGITLVAAALVLAPSAFADDALPLPDLLSGEDAVQALGANLEAIAVDNELTPEQLREILSQDPSLRVDGDGRLIYVCTARPPAGEIGDTVPAEYASDGDVFALHSNPSATKVIYLDFTGHHSVSNSWGHNIQFPAYDTNGDSSEFVLSELFAIEQWFKYVAEDYAPFNVDVTTEDPGLEALRRSGGGDDRWGIRCVMTQPTAGFGNGIGGVALLNSFDDTIDNPCFVFNKGNNNGSMSASHEVGHTLGLSHDGLSGNPYHPGCCGFGETSWGPIMGAPFGKQCVHWSKGEYSGANNQQNDVAIITRTSNGFDEFPDDHGNTIGTATVIDVCPDPTMVEVQGLIELRTDVDAFRFVSAAGSASISLTTIHPGHNIDLLLEVYEAGGSFVASNNPLDDVDAALNVDLAAGEYVILVDGVAHPSNYSDYGCLGTYFLDISLPAASGGCLCPEDLNGSGSVDFGDILAILSAWGNAGGPEDLDGSGTVDFQDILVVLGAWGDC